MAEQISDTESFDSKLEWELDEGIPQPEDAPIRKYMFGRKALIEQERKQRHDRIFKQTMSPLAKQAAVIMAALREQELQTVWTPNDQDELFHGMPFTLARAKMEKTELWKIIEKMPKGALLHAHMDAMFDIDWLIDQILNEEGFCIMAPESLFDEKKRQTLPVAFGFVDQKEVFQTDSASVWSESYVANTPIPIKIAASNFPGGENEFIAWLTSRCTITQEESISHHHGLNAVWRKFTSTFAVIRHMFTYEPIFRRAMQRMLAQLAADGISYIDFRMAFVFDFCLQSKSTPQEGYSDFFRIFGEEIDKFKATEAGQNFHGTRMIWTVIRSLDNKSIVESMKECIRIKQEFPHLVCGFDCVGQEDRGRTLADLTPILFWFKKKCYEAGVEIPFFFHAGECLGDGDATDSNLYDAILLGTRRIGHGYSLYKHPLLIDMVKEKKILVESCPISNEVLRLSSSILGHSVPALLSRGVAVSLNNDDPAILGHGKNGLTHDYWQLFMASENLGLEGLATMAENSLRWCAVEDEKQGDWLKGINDAYMGKTIKASMLKQWRQDFDKWCQWVIMEFPLDVDDTEEDLEDDD